MENINNSGHLTLKINSVSRKTVSNTKITHEPCIIKLSNGQVYHGGSDASDRRHTCLIYPEGQDAPLITIKEYNPYKESKAKGIEFDGISFRSELKVAGNLVGVFEFRGKKGWLSWLDLPWRKWYFIQDNTSSLFRGNSWSFDDPVLGISYRVPSSGTVVAEKHSTSKISDEHFVAMGFYYWILFCTG